MFMFDTDGIFLHCRVSNVMQKQIWGIDSHFQDSQPIPSGADTPGRPRGAMAPRWSGGAPTDIGLWDLGGDPHTYPEPPVKRIYPPACPFRDAGATRESAPNLFAPPPVQIFWIRLCPFQKIWNLWVGASANGGGGG